MAYRPSAIAKLLYEYPVVRQQEVAQRIGMDSTVFSSMMTGKRVIRDNDYTRIVTAIREIRAEAMAELDTRTPHDQARAEAREVSR